MSDAISNRYEFILFFEVENGNPNGDPDAGNMPRIDPETSHGIVTDVCLKRKARNFVDLSQSDKARFDIYVRENTVLNDTNEKAYASLNIKPEPKKLPKDEVQAGAIVRYMCDRFFDIRAFGAVMTMEVNCGQVRGPIQFGFAKSLAPVVPQEITITRMAVTNKKDAEKERTMGRKFIVPYALFRAEGFISAPLAQKTGFTEADLDIFWNALMNMFEHDHSAARGRMSSRKLIIFKHDSPLGNAPAHELFGLVTAIPNDPSKPSRSYGDYTINIDYAGKPENVTIIVK